jgi:hypothetical protein
MSAAARRPAGRRPAARNTPARDTPAPAGYSGTPLPKKLGIKPGARVALVDAPPDFERTLGTLPEGATLVRRGGATGRGGRAAAADLTLWFVTSGAALARGLPRTAAACGARGEGGHLWIAWPKRASGVATDLTENVVRDAALAAGLVDYKVCAIDATWSGLAFARRS